MPPFSKRILIPAFLAAALFTPMPARAGLPGVLGKIISYKAKQVLEPTLWENRSTQPATLTVIDRFAPVGHALIVDADNGNLIQDLASSKDSFELPPQSRVGIVFLPTAKVLGLTLRIQAGDDAADALEFNLKKQCIIGFYGDPRWEERKGSTRIHFNRAAFEKPSEGNCWEVVDK